MLVASTTDATHDASSEHAYSRLHSRILTCRRSLHCGSSARSSDWLSFVEDAHQKPAVAINPAALLHIAAIYGNGDASRVGQASCELSVRFFQFAGRKWRE